MKVITLLLTCKNRQESDLISKSLLSKKLIVCAKEMSVSSSSIWQGHLERTQESLLIMDSIEENFAKIESEVTKLHSYKTFVLFAIPVIKTTRSVERWINKEIRK